MSRHSNAVLQALNDCGTDPRDSRQIFQPRVGSPLVPVSDNRTGRRRPDARKLVQFLDGSCVQCHTVVQIQVGRYGGARKSDQRLEGAKQRRTNPAHPIQSLERAKRSMGIAIRHNSRRHAGSHARQSPDFLHRSDVEINSFTWPKRSSHPARPGSDRIEGGPGSGCAGRMVDESPRCRARCRNHPDCRPGHTEENQKPNGTLIRGHPQR